MKDRSSFKITRAVIFALLLREMLTRFGARRMGAFWMLLEPVLHVVVMMFVMQTIRGRSIPGIDFSVYLVCGIVPFFLMRNIATRLMDAVSSNQSLFAYQQIKPLDTMIARTIVECALMTCVYLILMAGLAFWFEHDVIMVEPLKWFATISVGVIFSFGLGILLCAYTQIFPGAKTFIRLAFMFLYLSSFVIIPAWTVPAQYLEYVLWNPYFHIIDLLREAQFASYPDIHGVNFEFPAKVALVTLFLGLAVYRLRRHILVAT